MLLLVIVQHFLHQKLGKMLLSKKNCRENGSHTDLFKYKLNSNGELFSQSSVSFFYSSVVSITVTVDSSMVVTDIITVIIIIQLVIAHILIGSQVYLLY